MKLHQKCFISLCQSNHMDSPLNTLFTQCETSEATVITELKAFSTESQRRYDFAQLWSIKFDRVIITSGTILFTNLQKNNSQVSRLHETNHINVIDVWLSRVRHQFETKLYFVNFMIDWLIVNKRILNDVSSLTQRTIWESNGFVSLGKLAHKYCLIQTWNISIPNC